MEEKSQANQKTEKQEKPEPRRPNETGSVSISGFVKIFDPKTQEVFVETRS